MQGAGMIPGGIRGMAGEAIYGAGPGGGGSGMAAGIGIGGTGAPKGCGAAMRGTNTVMHLPAAQAWLHCPIMRQPPLQQLPLQQQSLQEQPSLQVQPPLQQPSLQHSALQEHLVQQSLQQSSPQAVALAIWPCELHGKKTANLVKGHELGCSLRACPPSTTLTASASHQNRRVMGRSSFRSVAGRNGRDHTVARSACQRQSAGPLTVGR
jgi:hypothetical protein